MNRVKLTTSACLLALLLAAGWALAQTNADQARKMVQGYDLLEAGKMGQAQEFYEQVLKEDPGNPLALNNLGAIMVKKQKYKEALGYLEQARTRAKGYKVRVNRVCDVEGICLAFRPLEAEYGNQDLEPLIKLNLEMVRGKLQASPKAK
jgi:tetratricopeptide (TPR) repeat protein